MEEMFNPVSLTGCSLEARGLLYRQLSFFEETKGKRNRQLSEMVSAHNTFMIRKIHIDGL